MTIKDIRSLTGLSQAAFSSRYDIPKRSIENWENDTRTCAPYLAELLEFKVNYDLEHGEFDFTGTRYKITAVTAIIKNSDDVVNGCTLATDHKTVSEYFDTLDDANKAFSDTYIRTIAGGYLVTEYNLEQIDYNGHKRADKSTLKTSTIDITVSEGIAAEFGLDDDHVWHFDNLKDALIKMNEPSAEQRTIGY